MRSGFKKLLLGLALIGATSAVLLLSDANRRSAGPSDMFRVAVLQFASSPVMEDGVSGMRAGLTESGLLEGRDVEIRIYNSEGDIPTANTIAAQLVSGQFDLVLTSGTPAMQAVANANRDGKTIHVFGLVADPFRSGVGLKRDDPLDHPAHFVGIGSLLPIVPGSELARELYPDLKAIGLVWNPAESNSEILTLEARKLCSETGIELLEATVDNSAGVFEAASSLAARGADALLISGDNTVASAPNSILSAAKGTRIPVFSILAGKRQAGRALRTRCELSGGGSTNRCAGCTNSAGGRSGCYPGGQHRSPDDVAKPNRAGGSQGSLENPPGGARPGRRSH